MTTFTQICLETSIMDIPGLKEALGSFCVSPKVVTEKSHTEGGLILGVEITMQIHGSYIFVDKTPANLARTCVWLGSELEPWHTFVMEARYQEHLPAIAEACRLLTAAECSSLTRALRGMHEASGDRSSHFSIILAATYGCVRRTGPQHNDQFVIPLEEIPDDEDFQDFIDAHTLVLSSGSLSQHDRLAATELGRSLSALCHPIHREHSLPIKQVYPSPRVLNPAHA